MSLRVGVSVVQPRVERQESQCQLFDHVTWPSLARSIQSGGSSAGGGGYEAWAGGGQTGEGDCCHHRCHQVTSEALVWLRPVLQSREALMGQCRPRGLLRGLGKPREA